MNNNRYMGTCNGRPAFPVKSRNRCVPSNDNPYIFGSLIPKNLNNLINKKPTVNNLLSLINFINTKLDNKFFHKGLSYSVSSSYNTFGMGANDYYCILLGKVFARIDRKKYIKRFGTKFDNNTKSKEPNAIFVNESNSFYCVKVDGVYILATITSNNPEDFRNLSIYFIGKDYKRIENKFKNTIKNIVEKNNNVINIGSVSKKENYAYNNRCHFKYLKDVFIDKEVKDKIINYIDFINKNSEKYNNLSINGSILLYGEPGTGKTSIIKSIAAEYQYNIFSINGSDISMQFEAFTRYVSDTNNKCILLIEDIDYLFKNKDSDENIRILLQIMDGVYTVPNLIVIATTNDIDRIITIREGTDNNEREIQNKAFMRRFDIIEEIKPIGRDLIKEMLKSYDLTIDDLNLNDVESITGNDLEKMIKRYYINKAVLNNTEGK